MRRLKQKLVLAALVAAASCGGLSAAELTLVKDGVPLVTICVPARTEFEGHTKAETAKIEQRLSEQSFANEKLREMEKEKLLKAVNERKPGDEELLAAEELASILRTISGAEIAVRRVEGDQLPAGPAILLGSELARKAGLGAELDKLDPDGLICRVQGDKLVLTGRRARGTLYAAYEFLESLGCRWVMPGPFGELYPSAKTVTTSINTTQNPSHAQRYYWCTYGNGKEYPQWTLRNKGNFVKAVGDQTVAQGHALGGPLRWGATQTNWQIKVMSKVKEAVKGADGKPLKDEKGQPVMQEVEKEVNALPDEFYAQVNGKPSHANPNFANPKAWDLYAQHYIDFFNKNPGVDYVSLSAEDGLVIDERADSVRLRSNEFDQTLGVMTATDQLWFFHNRVIEQVVKVHPKKKFGILVYNNLTPPRLTKIHPNMALVFAPLAVCPLHDVRDEKCKVNRWYRTWLEDWMRLAKSAGAETYYYDYEPTGFSWNMAMICPRWGIIGRNYPWFHEMGLDGYTSQGMDDSASCGLDNYLMMRLYWNVKQDYREVIADYAKARFGAAAPAMVEYYNLLEKRMNEIPDLYQNEVWANHLVLTPEVRKQARTILDKAVKLADTDRAKAHIQTMVDLQATTDAACDAIENADETGDFGKAARTMDAIWPIRDRLNTLYSHFMGPNHTSEKELVQFKTGGIYNQYLGFDKRIKGAKASLLLPRVWKGLLDTGQKAQALGYYKPDAAVDTLDDLDVTLCPDVKYKTEREAAAFFYRTQVKVPGSFKGGQKITLYFTSIIAKGLQIWVNGQEVEFDYDYKGPKPYKDTVWRGPDYFWINYNHEQSFDVTPYIKPGQLNTIAFRVFKSFDIGGTYRRVYLLAE
jgi:hypothetical protein